MPRQKITAGTAWAADLPDLTAQQQMFVEGILSGKTASDAYRAAYNTESMAARTVWAEASRLRSNPAVAAWITAARIAGLGSAVVTYESHVRELERIKEIALESGNIGAAVQAEQIRGKAAGLHVDQVRDITDRHDPAQTLREIAVHSPELAASLAAVHGIELAAEAGATKH